MNTTEYPISISKLEKTFGPYIPGKGAPTHTISAIKQVTSGAGRGTYIGVPGIVVGAEFHVQFPTAINLRQFHVSVRGAKHVADSVKDLATDGPQGGHGRREAFEAWRVAQSWEGDLQQLSGDFEAEIVLPALKRKFAATFSISGSSGKKKVALKGKLRPLG
jgi:hypothetical protein